MAGCINQANVKFSNMFRQGSGVYRDLAQDPDQIVDSHEISVELKTSAEGEEEVVRSFSQNLQKSPKRKWSNLAKITVLVVFVFITGYLVGYVTHRKPRINMNAVPAVPTVPTVPAVTTVTTVTTVDTETSEDNYYKPSQPFEDWNSVVAALRENLTPAAMDKTLQEISSQDLQAGSDGERVLGQKVLEKFRTFGMDHWKDVHYVKLQVPSGENKVLMGSEVVGSPKGYLAYSATGTKQGKVVYANYGRREDLEKLKNQGINLEEKIALIRAGKFSLAEKVGNAAQFGLAAVLIYQETSNERELNTELYGQVHLGTGDPYTPGFPSFNHTQFPPSESSGLPKILAQTITAETARKIHLKMKGKDAPSDFSGKLPGVHKYTLGGEMDVTVTVNNVLVDTEIHNVFGVIKGFTDPDRYVVLGAQRDAFGGGFAKSTVGTSLLVELARAVTNMLKAGFKPRRSIVFASWSAGDFGIVGATEWLEGYLSSLNLRAFTYISLDATVSGVKQFKASSSPLLHKLLKNTMNEMKNSRDTIFTLSRDFLSSDWTKFVLEPMRMDDGAYPFLAFSGIPSVSFRFVSDSETSDYKYFGTFLDTRESLNQATEGKLLNVCVSAAQMAGQMALRLVHDHILNLDVSEYNKVIMNNVLKITKEIRNVEALGVNSSSVLKDRWLYFAVGSFSRAVSVLNNDKIHSDLDDAETCRNINDRLMRVEHNLLSPYVSPRDVPFRHIIFGSGDYSVSTLLQHLSALKQQAVGSDADLFRNQFALITWTIQSCANDLKGNIQGLDN
ncbi:transferrin receptor 1b [Tachysurus ichikawai]